MGAPILFTAYALLAAACFFAAWVAHRAAERAAHHATQLQQARGRLIAAEHSLEALDSRLKRLNGRLDYANRREREAEEAEPETPEQTRARLRAGNGLPKVGPRPISAGLTE